MISSRNFKSCQAAGLAETNEALQLSHCSRSQKKTSEPELTSADWHQSSAFCGSYKARACSPALHCTLPWLSRCSPVLGRVSPILNYVPDWSAAALIEHVTERRGSHGRVRARPSTRYWASHMERCPDATVIRIRRSKFGLKAPFRPRL